MGFCVDVKARSWECIAELGGDFLDNVGLPANVAQCCSEDAIPNIVESGGGDFLDNVVVPANIAQCCSEDAVPICPPALPWWTPTGQELPQPLGCPALDDKLGWQCGVGESKSGSAFAVSFLEVHNNEQGLRHKVVVALCSKRELTDTTREKGLGFKSVFKYTAAPHIVSSGYLLKFVEPNATH